VGAVQSTKPVTVDRLVVVSSAPFEAVVARLEAAVGHPDMQAFGRDVAAADTYAELERIVHEAVGPSGFMEMARFDIGLILRKETGLPSPKILRLVIGNPLILRPKRAAQRVLRPGRLRVLRCPSACRSLTRTR